MGFSDSETQNAYHLTLSLSRRGRGKKKGASPANRRGNLAFHLLSLWERIEVKVFRSMRHTVGESFTHVPVLLSVNLDLGLLSS
jgi:hypothetical protein